MSIVINSLSNIAPEKIADMFATMTQLVQEKHPEIELTRGVFHDLVLYFTSVLNAALQENVDRITSSNSLKKILADPTLADPDIVDQILSNYGLTRDSGSPATGLATVVLTFNENTPLPKNLVLTAGSVKFNLANDYIILNTSGVPKAADEVVMTDIGNDTYVANVLVVAQTVGTAGNISRGTILTPDSQPVNVKQLYTTTDFTTGREPATNTDYIAKLPTALAAKTIGGRSSYIAAIKNQAAFQNIRAISVLGCGDAEQIRDQHGLFPISGGGKVDVYVQSSGYAQVQDYYLTATYVQPSVTGTIWKITLPRTIFPGFYEVTGVTSTAANANGQYAVTEDDRRSDLAQLDFVPSFKYEYESEYTRYQSAVILFEDTDTTALGLTPNVNTAIYKVSIAGMPLIAEVQDFLADRDNRSRTTDVLVRAAIPCFTSISVQILKDANDPDPDLSAIKLVISDTVSANGFTGQLHASQLTAAVQPLLLNKQVIGKIDLFGRIRRPGSTPVYLHDSAVLRIPDSPEHLVTGRTTAFLTRPDDVSVSTVTAGFAG